MKLIQPIRVFLIAAVLFAAGSSMQAAHTQHEPRPKDLQPSTALLLVIAQNPLFGALVEPTLIEAEVAARQMTSLDPVCGAVPAACELRYEATEYLGVYADGQIVPLVVN